MLSAVSGGPQPMFFGLEFLALGWLFAGAGCRRSSSVDTTAIIAEGRVSKDCRAEGKVRVLRVSER